MDEFLKELALILEVKKVNPTDKLQSFSLLDSLAILSIIAMLDARYGINISTAEVTRMSTAEDLWNHVQCMINPNNPAA